MNTNTINSKILGKRQWLLVLLASLLCGCGQSGALQLPAEAQQQTSH